MCLMNYAITQSLLPDLDVTKSLTPKQFVTRYELEDYLLVDVNNMFRAASEKIKDKSYFLQQNHIIP